MCSVPVFVGLDYHQDSVQVCVMNEAGSTLYNKPVANDVDEIERSITLLGAPRRVAIESCCGAADLAEKLATGRNLPIQLAHPGYVSRMKRSPDKTDLGDAQLLADLVRVNYLPRVWLAPQSTRELRRLVRHRAAQVRRRRDIKLRVRGLLRENRLRCDHARAWTKSWHAWVRQEAQLSESDRWIVDDLLDDLVTIAGKVAAIEARIKMAVADDPLVHKLLSLFGVGLVTAVTLRAEIGRFDRFDNGKQLARFCGVTPRNASSGARQADAGLIKAGNLGLRQALIELAQRLKHRDKGRWGKLAQEMRSRGKPHNVIVAAIANRWVRWLHHEIQRPIPDATSAPTQQKGSAPSASTIASTAAAG